MLEPLQLDAIWGIIPIQNHQADLGLRAIALHMHENDELTVAPHRALLHRVWPHERFLLKAPAAITLHMYEIIAGLADAHHSDMQHDTWPDGRFLLKRSPRASHTLLKVTTAITLHMYEIPAELTVAHHNDIRHGTWPDERLLPKDSSKASHIFTLLCTAMYAIWQ